MFEKLLSLIERGVAALEKIAASPSPAATAAPAAAAGATAAAKPGKTKPKAPEPEADPFADPPAVQEKEYTRQEVRDALVAYSQKDGQSQSTAVALVAKHGGVDKFSDLPKEKFAAVYKAATA
jgi:hypothetical protein